MKKEAVVSPAKAHQLSTNSIVFGNVVTALCNTTGKESNLPVKMSVDEPMHAKKDLVVNEAKEKHISP